jgi:hypothetical protein
MLVGVLLGAGLVWLAAGGMVAGEFTGRGGGRIAFKDKPVAFIMDFVMFIRLGVLFLWGCVPGVLKLFARR